MNYLCLLLLVGVASVLSAPVASSQYGYNPYNPYMGGGYGGYGGAFGGGYGGGYGGFGGGFGGGYPGGFGGGYGGGYGGFGNGFGSGFGSAFGFPAQTQPQPVKTNYLWLCLEDIFPADVRAQVGLPDQIGKILSSYATHAYVLHGTTPENSLAWQMTLEKGQDFWTKLLIESKSMDINNYVEWGKKKAASIEGRAKISSAPGGFVYSHSTKCFKSSSPSVCSDYDIQKFSDEYYQRTPVFNLLTNNCASYACKLLEKCSASASCSGSCVDSLTFQPMNDKNPGCGTSSVPIQQQYSNLFGSFPFANSQTFEEDDVSKEFMPMHVPSASKIVTQRLLEQTVKQENSHIADFDTLKQN
eukprot:c21657_g1_i1.p1 GENE.c21657_g1_i1~~c21657_g1_i1.p1  ORF type:complete len:373 (+),score=159.24 c21657_g1_i1:49-1119(+)